MIERNHAEIHKINPQVADNARRVMRINEDCKIFEDRKDLDIPGSHKPSQIYTILIDTNMPKDLQTNYEREYKQHYAVTKNMPPEITVKYFNNFLNTYYKLWMITYFMKNRLCKRRRIWCFKS